MKVLIVSILILSLCGCVSINTAPREMYEDSKGLKHYVVPRTTFDALVSTKICCESFSNMSFDELPYGREIVVKIDEASPVFNFESGRSFFKAFRLPIRSVSYNIRIRSYFSGHVFFPSALVLDCNFNIVRKYGDETFKFGEKGLDSPNIKGDLAMLGEPEKEAYMIIYTEQGSGVIGVTRHIPALYGLYGQIIPPHDVVNHYSPIGAMKINLN